MPPATSQHPAAEVPGTPGTGTQRSRATAWGVAFVVISSTGFGFIPWFATRAYASGADPFGLLMVRFPIATLTLLLLRAFGVHDGPFPRGRELLQTLALGAVGYVAQASFYFSALTYIPSSLDAILLYMFPGGVVLLSALLFGERPGRATITCLGIAFAGCILVVGPAWSGSTLGIALGLGAAASYACYIVASSRVLPGNTPMTSLTLVMAGGSIGQPVLALFRSPTFPSGWSGWSGAVGVAIVGTVVGMGFFFAGLARLGAADTSVLANIEPMVSVLVGVLVLGEVLRPTQVLGGAVLLGAVTALALFRARAARGGDIDAVPEPYAP